MEGCAWAAEEGFEIVGLIVPVGVVAVGCRLGFFVVVVAVVDDFGVCALVGGRHVGRVFIILFLLWEYDGMVFFGLSI